MADLEIFKPMIGMAALTGLVWIKLYYDRLGEMSARGIKPDDFRSPKGQTLLRINASDNFKNLFEVPVLFYVLCLALFVSQLVTPNFVNAAWAYVALRTVHSAIHCTYNKIAHRFTVYVFSTMVVIGMWGVFAMRVWNLA
jgi:hypothetical protein